jgi:hypothetical protein
MIEQHAICDFCDKDMTVDFPTGKLFDLKEKAKHSVVLIVGDSFDYSKEHACSACIVELQTRLRDFITDRANNGVIGRI